MKAKKAVGQRPQAFAALRQMPGTRVWFWVVDSCPLCGGSHVHPAGGPRDDPEERLGEVAAPCQAGATYRLSLPPKPLARGGKRARHKRERRAGRQGWEDEE